MALPGCDFSAELAEQLAMGKHDVGSARPGVGAAVGSQVSTMVEAEEDAFDVEGA